MSPYMICQIVQAEQAAQARQHARCGTSQRQADAQLGELAAAMAQWSRGLAWPAAAVRAALRHRRPGWPLSGTPRLAREKW
ncbi:MAG TPA: hypothetical protein VMH35_06820 [Streptosporangiaceae bacterium]|nr:hypothetical protein [Streptosporangiaceae bacterium]